MVISCGNEDDVFEGEALGTESVNLAALNDAAAELKVDAVTPAVDGARDS